MKPWQKIFSMLGLVPIFLVLGFGGPGPEDVYVYCPLAHSRVAGGVTIYYVTPNSSNQIVCVVFHAGAHEVGAYADISLLPGGSPGSTLGAPESNTTDANGTAYRTFYSGAASGTPNFLVGNVLVDVAGDTVPHNYVPVQYELHVENLPTATPTRTPVPATPTKTVTPLPAGITSDSAVYPNPFNPLHGENANLYYKLTEDAPVKISIYTLRGDLAYEKSFAAGEKPGGAQGPNLVPWDGRNNEGLAVGNGVYLCVIRVSDKELYRFKIGLYKGE